MIVTTHDLSVHSGQSPSIPPGWCGARSWDLVADAQGGNREAFGRLYQRYAGGVFSFVLARTGDRVLAEDVTSETFLRALRRIDSVRDQGQDVGAWFTTIARNLLLDHVKSSRHRLETTAAEVPERPTATTVVGPEQAVVERDTAEQLWRYVAQLSPDQRDCIRLRFGQGLSTAQTAAAMGRTELAVRGLRHRALGQLREAMTAATGPVSTAREADADPIARARQAVVQARHRRGADRQTAKAASDQRQGRWHTDEQRRASAADGLGVA